MAKTHKITTLLVLAIGTILILIGGFYVVRSEQYERSFLQVTVGQSKQTVISLMGNASESRSCNFPIYDSNKNLVGDCSEIIFYRSFYQQWALAFNEDGKVIEKYYWFLGEYGNRPPDSNQDILNSTTNNSRLVVFATLTPHIINQWT